MANDVYRNAPLSAILDCPLDRRPLGNAAGVRNQNIKGAAHNLMFLNCYAGVFRANEIHNSVDLILQGVIERLW